MTLHRLVKVIVLVFKSQRDSYKAKNLEVSKKELKHKATGI